MAVIHNLGEACCYPDDNRPEWYRRWSYMYEHGPHFAEYHAQHLRAISAFFMDKYLVTNAQYQTFGKERIPAGRCGQFFEALGLERPRTPDAAEGPGESSRRLGGVGRRPGLCRVGRQTSANGRGMASMPRVAQITCVILGATSGSPAWPTIAAKAPRPSMPSPPAAAPSACSTCRATSGNGMRASATTATATPSCRGGSFYQVGGSGWYFDRFVQFGLGQGEWSARPTNYHTKLFLMSPSTDRKATIGFRCVKDVAE